MLPGVESHRDLIPDSHQERLTGSSGWCTDKWEGAREGHIPLDGGVRLWVSVTGTHMRPFLWALGRLHCPQATWGWRWPRDLLWPLEEVM